MPKEIKEKKNVASVMSQKKVTEVILGPSFLFIVTAICCFNKRKEKDIRKTMETI